MRTWEVEGKCFHNGTEGSEPPKKVCKKRVGETSEQLRQNDIRQQRTKFRKGRLLLHKPFTWENDNSRAGRMMGSNNVNDMKPVKCKDRDYVTLKTIKALYCSPVQIRPKA